MMTKTREVYQELYAIVRENLDQIKDLDENIAGIDMTPVGRLGFRMRVGYTNRPPRFFDVKITEPR